MFPKRRKPKRSGIRDDDGPIRCPAHLKHVRGFVCSVPGCDHGPIEAAHVRTGTDGGTGLKPSDCWVIPLCAEHHHQQHDVGEAAFEKWHRIDMKAIAQRLWQQSPAGRKWRMERGD